MEMTTANHVDRARKEGVLLGVPLGDLGWFQSLLMGTALGFAAFFLVTFLSIIALLFYSTAGHHTVDFAWSYKRAGLPAGLVVAVLALGFLAVQWSRRMANRGRQR